MRKAILLICFAAVAFAVVDAGKLKTDASPTFMDSLIIKALEFIRTLLKKNKNYTIPKDIDDRITDPQFNVQLKLSKLTISQADDFVINKIHNDVPKLTAEFGITLPHPTITGQYSIDGSAAGRKVQGSGMFTVGVENFYQTGFIQMKVKDGFLNMDSLKLDFTMNKATFAFDNMKVEGITQQQALDFMNKNLLPTINAKKAVVCDRFAEQIKLRANKMLAGKNLLQIIAWLNKLIKG